MKTLILPAQITSVEDKIIGNLNMTQLLILMSSLFISAVVFLILPTPMQINSYKVIIILLSIFLSIFLSFRYKDQLIIDWLVILLRFKNRPRYYVFDKRTIYLRKIDLNKSNYSIVQPVLSQTKLHTPIKSVSYDLRALDQLLDQSKFQTSIKFNQKGGLNVAVAKI